MSGLTKMPAFISRQVVRGRYYFGEGGVGAMAEIGVKCAGDEECTMDYRIEREGFMYQAVELIVSGQWELEMGGKRDVVGPGVMFGYGPESAYRMRVVGGQKPRKYFMDLQGHGVDAFLTLLKIPKDQPVVLGQAAVMEEWFEQLLACGHLPEAWRAGHASVLAQLILRTMGLAHLRKEEKEDRAYGTYLRIRQLILEEGLRMRGVEEVAARVGLNAAYVSRLFKRYAGEAPLVFLVRVKMQYAAELLTRRGVRVGEAGMAVGYEDAYHFSRVFKKVHGVSPSGYVKRNLKVES